MSSVTGMSVWLMTFWTPPAVPEPPTQLRTEDTASSTPMINISVLLKHARCFFRKPGSRHAFDATTLEDMTTYRSTFHCDAKNSLPS